MPPSPGDPDQLRPGGEELRRAAFVVVDMRFLVAENRVPGVDQRRKRESVRRRPRRHQKSGDLGLEYFAQKRLRPRGIFVGAVGGRVDTRRRDDRVQNLRRHAGAVVAGEIHARSRSIRADNLRQICAALAIRSRAGLRRQKICAPTACVGDPFLSWSENRTVVLTIFCAARLRLRRRQKSRAQALSDRTTKTDRKKSDA